MKPAKQKTGAFPAPVTQRITAPEPVPAQQTTAPAAHQATRTLKQVWDNIKLQLLLGLEWTVYIVVTTWLFVVVFAAGVLVRVFIERVEAQYPGTPHWAIFAAHCVEYFLYAGDLYGFVKRAWAHFSK
jgi:hypothetical protein